MVTVGVFGNAGSVCFGAHGGVIGGVVWINYYYCHSRGGGNLYNYGFIV